MTHKKKSQRERGVPEGSGTEEDPWFFPDASSQGEGIAMAHEFMNAAGPEFGLRKQYLVGMEGDQILEYWETDSGIFWFRYRMDRDIR